MDIDVKKKGLQSLMKALAMMPEGGEKEVSLGEVAKSDGAPVVAELEVEKEESPEEMAKEVVAEDAPEVAMEKSSVKLAPSIMEKINFDDLSLDEFKQIKEKFKTMGLL